MTIERIVPPYCGCGWHSTIAARGAPSGVARSASSARPSLVVITMRSIIVDSLLEAELVEPELVEPELVEQERLSTNASSRHAS